MLKKVLVGLGLTVGLLVTMYVAINLILPSFQPQIESRVKDYAKNKLDRELNWQGTAQIKINWQFIPQIKLKKFSLSNASWAKHPMMLQAESLEFSINLLSLLSGETKIKSVRAKDLSLALEINEKTNWQFAEQSTTTSLPIIELKNAKVSYYDHQQNQETNAQIKYLRITHQLAGPPIKFEVKFDSDGQRFKIFSSVIKENGSLRLSDLSMVINDTKLNGNLLIDFTNKKFKGNFKGAHLKIHPSAKSNERLIPATYIPNGELKGWQGKLSFSIKKIVMDQLQLLDNFIDTKIADGKLETKFTSKNTASGNLEAQLTTSLSNPPHTRITLKGNDLDTSQALQQLFGKTISSGGQSSLTVKLHGHGHDFRKFMANANGSILVQSHDVSVKTLADVDSNIFSKIFSGLYPKNAENFEPTTLKCVVINFKVDNGKAVSSNKIGLESSNFIMVGNGSINLETEAIDFEFIPQTTKAVTLPIGTTLDYVKLGGSLAKPQISIDPMGILKEGGSVAAAVATGGLSWIAEGVIDRVTSDATPCQSALEN